MNQDVLKKLHDEKVATDRLKRKNRLESLIWAFIFAVTIAAAAYPWWRGSVLWTSNF